MFLVFDIGGTKTRLAVSQKGTKLDDVVIIPTCQNFSQAMQQIRAEVFGLTKGRKIKAGAGGIAGRLDKNKNGLFSKKRSVNMPGWRGQPFKKSLQKIIQAPVYLENDADMAGLGEAAYGAGKDYKIVVYLTVSTGCGGVRIVDKKIDANTMGFEPGHQIINYDDMSFADKLFPGTLESYVSGRGFEARYRKSPKDIKSVRIWSQVRHILTLGILNTIMFWSPDIIVLGGGIMNSRFIKLSDIRKELFKLRKFPVTPVLQKASLGERAGLMGALYYLKFK